jgi:hypothetical protein
MIKKIPQNKIETVFICVTYNSAYNQTVKWDIDIDGF